MSTTQRIYPTSDVDMLTVAMIIAENAKENQDFLSAKRPAWEPPFFDNLITRIEKTSSDVLGIKSVHQLVEASNAMRILRDKLLNDIAELKIQIKVDYADNKQQKELLLNKLGIGKSSNYRKSQQALTQTVEMLQAGLTPDVVTQMQEKGIAAPAVNSLVADSREYIKANILQEQSKLKRSSLSAANVKELNSIYTTIIGITKIARTFYKGQPKKQAKFSFSKIKKNLTGGKSATQTEMPENTDTSQP